MWIFRRVCLDIQAQTCHQLVLDNSFHFQKDRLSYATRVNEASSLRKEMAKITIYKSDANVTTIDSYIGVLKSFVNAFSPVCSFVICVMVQDTAITFKWKSNKGKYVKTNSLHSELACVLYNKAALLTQHVALKIGTVYGF